MHSPRRLNLLAFPTETNALFSLLILASITLTLFFTRVFGIIFYLPGSVVSAESSARGLEVTAAYLPGVILSIIVLFAVLGVALILYFRHPSAIQRRRKISSISEKDQEIQKQVNELSLQAGVDPPEIQMPAQSLRGTDAQAFGVGKFQKIGLDGGLRIIRKTKPKIFNALIHHELAHFANEDIARSYFSDALWKSLRWIIVLPFVLGIAGNILIDLLLVIRNGDLQTYIQLAQIRLWWLLQFSLVLVVAAVLWTRLLRAREFYADWRAVPWGSQDGLKRIFQEEVEKENPKTQKRILIFHPSAKDRIEAIEHPEILFTLPPVFVFLAGVHLSFLLTGLYFALASFLTFAGVLQSIRDATTGPLYWLVRGVFWVGIVFLFVVIFGLTGWLINSVLLPQIQKQIALDLIKKQRGLLPYLRLLIVALMLVAGIEIGFLITPFGQFAPIDLWGYILEIFIVTPILVLSAWWYLTYIRFISLRVSAVQMGKSFSSWRSRFIKTASVLWVFLFFIPGLLLSRYLSGDLLETFLYASVIWLIFTVLFSPVIFSGSWAIIKLFLDKQPKNCPHCGKITRHTSPVIELCEHCGGVLGEWLFVPEQIQLT